MQSDLLITADWVLPVTSAPILHGAVLVGDGRIRAFGHRDDLGRQYAEAGRLDLGCAALLPGLVNVHTHLELTALRGFLEEEDFFTWIRKLTDTKYARLTPADLRLSAYWGVVELVRAGITTVGEVCDLGVSLGPLAEAGLRGVLYQEVFGPTPADAASRLEDLRDKLRAHEEAAGARIQVGVSPHAPYTVSAELFHMVTELALEEGYPLSVHAAESAAERSFLLEGKGPFADHLRERGIDWQPPGCSAVRYLDRLGVLRARPLLVHCVDCSAEDLELLTFSGATIAHCPKSNAKLRHGVAPLASMLAMGIRVGMGSDGVASNNTVDLFEEVRAALLFHRAVASASGCAPESLGEKEAIRLMTIAGAEALGKEKECGSIEAGKQADLVGVKLSTPHLQPVHDVEAAIVWGASARDVILTMVGGDVLYEGGRVRPLDEAALLEEIRAVARKLSNDPTEIGS